MKNFVTLVAALCVVLSSQAQLNAVVHEVVYTDDGTIAAYPAGATTYRIYAELTDGADAVTAVYAEAGSSLLLGTDNDLMWSTSFGATTGDAINPGFFGFVPESEYDSMVTIGRANAGDPGGSVTAVSVIPSNTAIDDAFGATLPSQFNADLVMLDGTWFSTPDQVNTNGVGPNFRVLLAQITTTGDIEYNLNIQLLDDGIGGTALKYVWDPASVDQAEEVDGSSLGLAYAPSADVNGCTDATACNYNSAANVDDSSCVFAVGCDTCSGETDGTGVVVDNPEVGESCDDGDAATTGDTVQADCSCAGIDPSLPQSQLDYAAGDYDLCDMIKADWVLADDYRFVFTPQPSGMVIQVEQGGPNTFLQLTNAMGLEVGTTYSVTVDALFGATWSVGTVSTNVTIVAPTPEVNPNDVCAAHGPHFLGDYISATPYVCGGDKWEWTFFAEGELPIVYTRNSANRFIRLSNVPGLAPGTSYQVSTRAGYANGAFTNASAQACVSIVGTAPSGLAAGGPEQTDVAELARTEEAPTPTAAIYPNPNNGEFMNVNLTGVEGKVTVDFINGMGAMVRSMEMTVAGDNVNEVIALNGIASGVYMVNITVNNTVITERLVVQK